MLKFGGRARQEQVETPGSGDLVGSELDTPFSISDIEKEVAGAVTKRVTTAVATEVSKQISDPSFLKRVLNYIGEKTWAALNTKGGKIFGGTALGLLALKIGMSMGQPLAGVALGGLLGAAGWTKFNPYHAAIGVGVGLTALAITAPIGLGFIGLGIAGVALPASTFIAGKLKLWEPKSVSG